MAPIPPLPSSRYQAVMELLRAADTIWDASRVFFARWDLSPSQFNVLNLLADFPAGLSQTELGRELIMHRSNLTGLVDILERRELVKRLDLAGDRRAYRVVLTRSGMKLVREIRPRYFRGAEQVARHLPPERAAALSAELRQMASNAKRTAGELSGRPFDSAKT
jgi:DNA-binding MarR family transcriptional regulator